MLENVTLNQMILFSSQKRKSSQVYIEKTVAIHYLIPLLCNLTGFNLKLSNSFCGTL